MYERCKQLVDQLALFSDNESIDDVTSSELKYLPSFPDADLKILLDRLLSWTTDRETLHYR